VQILLTDEFIDKMLADVSDISDVEEVSFRIPNKPISVSLYDHPHCFIY